MVALHAAGEAASLGSTHHIDDVTFFEQVRAQRLAELVAVRVVNPDLAQPAELSQTLEVTTRRVVDSLAGPEANLYGVVAVVVLRLDLHDHARPCFYHGDTT